ncbi:MAG: HAMP domain-containing sensor histidine kinase [bacterium]
MNLRNLFKNNSAIILRILSIRFLHELLITPKSTSEDIQRKEYVLNWVLVGTISLITILTVSSLVTYFNTLRAYTGISPLILLVITIGFSSLLYLSRKGFITLSSWLLIGIYSAITLYAVYVWSFVLPMIILGMILIITISSILFSTRFGALLTLILSGIISSITWLQITHIIPLHLYWQDDPLSLQDIFEVCFIFACIVGISWLANRETEKSLARARVSEQELIQERNLLELRVQERTQELKELQLKQVTQLTHLADLGRLSTGIFHDLISPLSGIIAHVDQLSQKNHEFLEMKAPLQKIASSTKRMGEALSLVRKQIRPETNSVLFYPGNEVRDVIDILTYKARIASVVITFNDHSKDFSFKGSPFLFYQIALNLITNAIESYHGTTTQEKVVIVSLMKQRNHMVFTVTDYGSGITPEHKQSIFTHLYTTKPQGNGLGLSHVKNIVEEVFKGSISFISDTYNGTTFSVIIPIPHQ